jgi:hypothetical protein
MKYKFAIVAGSLVFTTALLGCGGTGERSQKSAAFPTTINPGAKPVDPATAGSLTGTIRLDGPPPAMRTISMAAVQNCVKARDGEPAMTEDVVPGDDGTLQNVVVYLKGDFSQ